LFVNNLRPLLGPEVELDDKPLALFVRKGPEVCIFQGNKQIKEI
jgi:hypothetical protein